MNSSYSPYYYEGVANVPHPIGYPPPQYAGNPQVMYNPNAMGTLYAPVPSYPYATPQYLSPACSPQMCPPGMHPFNHPYATFPLQNPQQPVPSVYQQPAPYAMTQRAAEPTYPPYVQPGMNPPQIASPPSPYAAAVQQGASTSLSGELAKNATTHSTENQANPTSPYPATRAGDPVMGVVLATTETPKTVPEAVSGGKDKTKMGAPSTLPDGRQWCPQGKSCPAQYNTHHKKKFYHGPEHHLVEYVDPDVLFTSTKN